VLADLALPETPGLDALPPAVSWPRASRAPLRLDTSGLAAGGAVALVQNGLNLAPQPACQRRSKAARPPRWRARGVNGRLLCRPSVRQQEPVVSVARTPSSQPPRAPAGTARIRSPEADSKAGPPWSVPTRAIAVWTALVAAGVVLIALIVSPPRTATESRCPS
jgi:hypothetical protein